MGYKKDPTAPKRKILTHRFYPAQELRALTKRNQHVCYNILFRSACLALSELCEEELGIKPGMISMLHTWGQNLSYHPHVHTIIPNGGIDLKTNKCEKENIISSNHLICDIDLRRYTCAC